VLLPRGVFATETTKRDPLRRIAILPICPMTLVCPLCGAKPGEDCKTSSGEKLRILHVAKIKAAAHTAVAAKSKRKERQVTVRRGCVIQMPSAPFLGVAPPKRPNL